MITTRGRDEDEEMVRCNVSVNVHDVFARRETRTISQDLVFFFVRTALQVCRGTLVIEQTINLVSTSVTHRGGDN